MASVAWHVRIFGHDVRRHGVAVGGDDAGDDKQQRPCEHLKCDEQVEHEGVAEDVKAGKQVLKPGFLAVDQLQAEAVVADGDAAADDELRQRDDPGYGEKYAQRVAQGLGIILRQVVPVDREAE